MKSDILQPKNRKRGRPPTGEGIPVQVRLKESLLKSVDTWRRQQEDLPSRPEAIRRLIEQSLAPTVGRPRKR
jgi:hypothetical protein